MPEHKNIRLPASKRGRLIGKKGHQIRRLEELGKTRFFIFDDPVDSAFFQVSIYGTPKNIEKTLSLIDELYVVQNQVYDLVITRVGPKGLHVGRMNKYVLDKWEGLIPAAEVILASNEKSIAESFSIGQKIQAKCTDEENTLFTMHNTHGILTEGEIYYLTVEKIFDFGLGLIGPDGRTPVFLHTSQMLSNELGDKKGAYVYNKGDGIAVRCINAKRKLMSSKDISKGKPPHCLSQKFQQVVVVQDATRIEALLASSHAKMHQIAQETQTVIFRQDVSTFCVKGTSTSAIDRAVAQLHHDQA